MDTPGAATATAAVMALKPLRHAKSRLGSLPGPLRRRLAWTMALDTLTTLAAVADQVVVVGDQPGLGADLARAGVAVDVLAEPPAGGMNAALSLGARAAVAAGATTVLACVGDLPALQVRSVRAVLAAATPFDRSFLADRAGTGTTMLVATRGDLDPRFGPGSADAHDTSGAVRLNSRLDADQVADAIVDVDTEDDLEVVQHLRLGPATAPLIDPATRRLGSYRPITVLGGGVAASPDGHRYRLGSAVSGDDPRAFRTGSRWHAVVGAHEVLTAWPGGPRRR